MGSPDRSPFRQIVLAVVLLISAIATAACPDRLTGGGAKDDEDRPVIIISSGSVIFEVKDDKWTRRDGKDYDQDVTRGKSVKSFTAETVKKTDDVLTGPTQCTISGATMIVIYGERLIVLSTKDDKVNGGKKAANVQFPADADVTLDGSYRQLTVKTDDAPNTIWNEKGDFCYAKAMNVRVKQNH